MSIPSHFEIAFESYRGSIRFVPYQSYSSAISEGLALTTSQGYLREEICDMTLSSEDSWCVAMDTLTVLGLINDALLRAAVIDQLDIRIMPRDGVVEMRILALT